MTAANDASGTPAEPTTQPQAGNNTPESAPQAGASTPETETLSLEEAKKLRQEHNSLRKRLAEYERAQQEAETAKLSDLEKTSKRAETAEAALGAMRQRIGASELKVAAQAAGIIDTDIAAALLGGKIDYDADGEPTNVAELVAQLKKDKPHLFGSQGQPQRPPSSSGGATNPGRQAGNGGLTLEMIEAMPMRERVARMGEIDAWYKARQQQR